VLIHRISTSIEVPMKKFFALAAVLVLVFVGTLAAHHSLASFDTSKPLHVKGTVVVFDMINPHSLIELDEKKTDGTVQRWLVAGPSIAQLDRLGIGKDTFKAGELLEACGFSLKDGQTTNTSADKPGKVLNGLLLVLPGGKRRFWSDYAQLQVCMNPGETRESIAW